jgi:hypothetical protein
MVFLELDFFMVSFVLVDVLFGAIKYEFFCCDLQMNQATPGSACHGFGAANDIHLGEDRFDV